MGFNNHGATRSECRSRVSTRHGKCQREIAGTEDRDRTQRYEHAPDIRLWRRFAIWTGAINSRIHPRPFADKCGKHSQLIHSTCALTGEAIGNGQCSFDICCLEQVVAERFDFRTYPLEKRGTLFCGDLAKFESGFRGRLKCQMDMFFVGFFKAGESAARREVTLQDDAGGSRFTGDEVLSVQFHSG